MIRTEALVYSYGRQQPPVLNAINLCIEEGEYVAIIGPNGCWHGEPYSIAEVCAGESGPYPTWLCLFPPVFSDVAKNSSTLWKPAAINRVPELTYKN